jgi:pimeloyl-ACP methyl ester carboxylesterase
MSEIQYICNQNNINLGYICEKYSDSVQNSPVIIYLSGFASNMHGTKATFLSDFTQKNKLNYLRFDYSGTGHSVTDCHNKTDYKLSDFVISDWINDTKTVINHVIPNKNKPLIIVGSSMGAWIAMKILQGTDYKNTSFIGIAPAPDFTKDLMNFRYDSENIKRLKSDGQLTMPCDFGGDDYIITQKFLDDADKNYVLDSDIDYAGRVHILHGMRDTQVPFERSMTLINRITSPDCVIEYIKNGDHSLSEPQDLNRLGAVIKEFYTDYCLLA